MNKILCAITLTMMLAPTTQVRAAQSTLIGDWKLNEGQGTVIKDSSENANNGTYTGKWIKGDFGAAILLQGNFVKFPTQPSLQVGTSNFTLECWVLPQKLEFDKSKKAKTLRLINAFGADSFFVVDLEDGGKPQLEMGMKKDGAWKYYCNVTAKQKIKLDKWSHLALVCDRKTMTLKVYINGIKDAEVPLPAPFKNVDIKTTFTIGSAWHGFWGGISDVVLSRDAQSAAQIKTQYEKKSSRALAAELKLITNPACLPEMRTDWSKGVAESLKQRATQGGIDVLFLGDSITHLWQINGNWPVGQKTWDKYYKPLNAANFGIAGDRTEHLLWRITEGKELENIHPKVTVLLIGTNNLHRPGNPDSPAMVAEGIELLIKTVRKKLPETKILLLAVFPRGMTPSDFQRKRVVQVNQFLPALADWRHVFYLDIGDHFLNSDGTAEKEILRDGLHLSEKGYEIWANNMNPYLFDLLKHSENKSLWDEAKKIATH